VKEVVLKSKVQDKGNKTGKVPSAMAEEAVIFPEQHLQKKHRGQCYLLGHPTSNHELFVELDVSNSGAHHSTQSMRMMGHSVLRREIKPPRRGDERVACSSIDLVLVQGLMSDIYAFLVFLCEEIV
jgi:hypothetical protein